MTQKIALLLPDLRAGGAQRVMLTLARAFTARNIQVDIVVGLAEGDLLSEVPPGARLIPLCARRWIPGQSGLAMVMLWNLGRYLKQQQPDVLLSTLTGTNLVAAAARRLARVPTRLVLREASRLANLRHPFYKPLMRRLYCWADAVVVLTPEMRAELADVLGLPREFLVTIPNPVDRAKLQRNASEMLPAEFDQSQPYILAVGRLAPPKDYTTLLCAFLTVVQSSPVNLVILGEGPDRPNIEAQIRSLSLEGRVVLRGYDPNPYRWMQRAAVFALSSRWEGYPNVIAEAQALGVPVVATEYDASAFTLVHPPGKVVPVGDAMSMADAISLLLATAERAKQGAQQGEAMDIHDTGKANASPRSGEASVINKYLDILLGRQ